MCWSLWSSCIRRERTQSKHSSHPVDWNKSETKMTHCELWTTRWTDPLSLGPANKTIDKTSPRFVYDHLIIEYHKQRILIRINSIEFPAPCFSQNSIQPEPNWTRPSQWRRYKCTMRNSFFSPSLSLIKSRTERQATKKKVMTDVRKWLSDVWAFCELHSICQQMASFCVFPRRRHRHSRSSSSDRDAFTLISCNWSRLFYCCGCALFLHLAAIAILIVKRSIRWFSTKKIFTTCMSVRHKQQQQQQ